MWQIKSDVLRNATKAMLYNLVPEEISVAKEVLDEIQGGLSFVYRCPKRKQWFRMDEVYAKYTRHTERLLRVLDYCLAQYQEMQVSLQIQFDLRDRMDYLLWALEWYSYVEPRSESVEEQEKKQAIAAIEARIQEAYDEDMRERVKKHELFNRTNWTRSTQCDLIFVHYL